MKTKRCCKCGEVKPVEEFYRRKYCCRACTRIYNKERYKAHHSELSASVRKYDEAHLKERTAYMKEYHAAHREEHLAYMKEYDKTLMSRACHLVSNHLRRVQKMGTDTIDSKTLARLIQDAWHCEYCGMPFESVRKRTVDHKIPLSRDGLHSRDNIAIVCLECNLSKHTRTLDEWQPETKIEWKWL